MLNENEVLDIMKNDLYQANERIKELEFAISGCIAFAECVKIGSQTYTSCELLIRDLKYVAEKK